MGRGNSLASRSGPGGERLPEEEKETQKVPTADWEKEDAIGAGTCEHYRKKLEHGGTGSRHTGGGQEGWTRSHKATWVPPSSRLPFSASAA